MGFGFHENVLTKAYLKNMLPFYQRALNERLSGYQKWIIMFTFWDWLLQFSTYLKYAHKLFDNEPLVFQINMK